MKTLSLNVPKNLVKLESDLTAKEALTLFENFTELVVNCSQQNLQGADILTYNEILYSLEKSGPIPEISLSESGIELLKKLYVTNPIGLSPKHIRLYCFYRKSIEDL